MDARRMRAIMKRSPPPPLEKNCLHMKDTLFLLMRASFTMWRSFFSLLRAFHYVGGGGGWASWSCQPSEEFLQAFMSTYMQALLPYSIIKHVYKMKVVTGLITTRLLHTIAKRNLGQCFIESSKKII